MNFSTIVKITENYSSDIWKCHQCVLKHLGVGLNLLFFKHLHKKTLVSLYCKYVVQPHQLGFQLLSINGSMVSTANVAMLSHTSTNMTC